MGIGSAESEFEPPQRLDELEAPGLLLHLTDRR
jgi:hypothetical protein